MARKKKVTGYVSEQRQIAPQIFDLWIETELAADAKAGQFVAVYPKNAATLLPRPISICETDGKRLRLVYRTAGAGTTEFSTYRAGEETAILGILGNGFPIEKAAGKRALLLGGGIGVPPMVQLAKELSALNGTSVTAAAGYRDQTLFLKEDLERYGNVVIATEDGSAGVKGNVLDAVREQKIEADIIFACGPMPMLRAVKAYAAKAGIPAYLSLEERMACGVGACLGCVCKTVKEDGHSHVKNARICTDGPVFAAEDVDI